MEKELITKENILKKIFLAKDNTRIESTLYNQMPPNLQKSFISKIQTIASREKIESRMHEINYAPRSTRTVYIRKDSDEGSKINVENIEAKEYSDRINAEHFANIAKSVSVAAPTKFASVPPVPTVTKSSCGPGGCTISGGKKRKSKRKTNKKRRTNRSKRIHKFRT